MKYLRFLDVTEPPSSLRLIDMALLLALFPLLFVMKIPVLVYVVLSVLLLFVKKAVSTPLLYFWMLLGLGMVGFAFIGEFNYAGLSRLKIFVSLLFSLLVYAVILQRLTRVVNAYLLVSPGLLLILSFFFFNSVTMLFYALFVLFIFVLLLLWHRMASPLIEVFKMSLILFSMALPAVVVLFLVFPRISFEKADYGFKGEDIARMGHDGTMKLGSAALLVPSRRVVMEVLFDEAVPPDNMLYFRGSVLYRDGIDEWLPRTDTAPPVKRRPIQGNSTYHITLYPHYKRWIYMLDLPLEYPLKSKMDSDFVIQYEKDIDDIFHYSGRSILRSTIPLGGNEGVLLQALKVDRIRYPMTGAAAEKIIRENINDRDRASAIYAFFKAQELTYSLRPKPMELKHLSDAFLFDTKMGYCVHFAAAFTTMARLSGIPARIVTGYKANRTNSVENYLIVREEDAHAWSELYLEGAGWVRYEPTATAVWIDDTVSVSEEGRFILWQSQSWEQGKLYFMYVKHTIESWILEYSHHKQMDLLKKMLEDTLFLGKFLGAFLLLVLASAGAFILLQKEQCRDAALCAMAPLLKLLSKERLHKGSSENMAVFLSRSGKQLSLSTELENISVLYHRIRYADKQDEKTLKALQNAVKQFKSKKIYVK